jgi:Uncharacterized protein conserved in bacteria (DUF2333)
MEENQDIKKKTGFKRFVFQRMLVAIVIIVAVVWALIVGLSYLERSFGFKDNTTSEHTALEPGDAMHGTAASALMPPQASRDARPEQASPAGGSSMRRAANETRSSAAEPSAVPAQEPAHEAALPAPSASPQAESTLPENTKMPAAAAPSGQAPEKSTAAQAPIAEKKAPVVQEKPLPPGVGFVEALIKPLDYELKDRWWGWRPNDIINITDNVNNFQLGVLEVTRRATVQLAERISRTGSNDAFNSHLQNAMNWLMIKPDQYWFPTPESKYKESLDELEAYKEQLLHDASSFYTRTDSIIPLLSAFEDLLGSCDENLVKVREKDGSKVSFFSTDNYFYYAKGIASAMGTILEAVQNDFRDTLEKRNGRELLHHAVESCRQAASLEPWLVTEGKLDGFLANHRANMAAPISHARFFLDQLIKTLST